VRIQPQSHRTSSAETKRAAQAHYDNIDVVAQAQNHHYAGLGDAVVVVPPIYDQIEMHAIDGGYHEVPELEL
jgi:hypothetical protein